MSVYGYTGAAQKEAARTPEPQRAPAVRRPAQPGAAQRQRQGQGKPKQGGPRRRAARPNGQKKGQQPRRGRGTPSGSRPALARQRSVAPREDAPLRRGNGGGMNLLIFLVVLLAAGIAGVVYFIMNNPEL